MNLETPGYLQADGSQDAQRRLVEDAWGYLVLALQTARKFNWFSLREARRSGLPTR